MTAEKVQILRENAGIYGLNTTLEAIELPKSTWYYWKSSKVNYEEKYRHLRGPLVDVLNENPMYGYRRVEPELKARGYPVGETVVQRVLGMWDLSLRRWVTKPKPSVPRKLLKGQVHFPKGEEMDEHYNDPLDPGRCRWDRHGSAASVLSGE